MAFVFDYYSWLCATTPASHWHEEILKFCKELIPMMYVGAPAVRQQLRLEFNKYNVIITTYDIARKDVDTFAEMRFNYCVLDEGHIIKVCFHIYIYI